MVVQTVPIAAFQTTAQLATILMIAVPTAIFIYTLYLVLYVTCIWVLLRRKREGYLWHIVSSTVLFVLETVNLALEVIQVLFLWFSDIRLVEEAAPSASEVAAMLLGFAKVSAAVESTNLLCLWMADIILTYRCFVIWNRDKRVLVLPTLFLLASIATQIPAVVVEYLVVTSTESSMNRIRLFNSLLRIPQTLFPFLITVAVTTTSVWRIWHINRRANEILAKHVRRRYSQAVSLLLESGLIYACLLLVVTIAYGTTLTTLRPNAAISLDSGMPLAYFILLPICLLFAGLLPTMMLAYVGLNLGVHTDEVKEIQHPKGHDLEIAKGIRVERDVERRSDSVFLPRDVQDGGRERNIFISEKQLPDIPLDRAFQDSFGARIVTSLL